MREKELGDPPPLSSPSLRDGEGEKHRYWRRRRVRPRRTKSPRTISGDPPLEQLQPTDLTSIIPALVVPAAVPVVPGVPADEPVLLPVLVLVPVPPLLVPSVVPLLVRPPLLVWPPEEVPVVRPPDEVPVALTPELVPVGG